MPRKHARRPQSQPRDLSFLANSGAASKTVRGREYHYRSMSAVRAVKSYSCPGCSNEIPAGTAHIVAWQADSIMGDAAAVAARRHWHTHCWNLF